MSISKSSSPGIFDPFPQNLEAYKNVHQRSYSKLNGGTLQKTTTIKVADGPVLEKPHKEEISRAIDDSEKISTAISSYEKAQNKSIDVNKYDHEHELVHNEYNKDLEESPNPESQEDSKGKENQETDRFYNSESLLDQIYSKQEEELCDDFLKDSMPHY